MGNHFSKQVFYNGWTPMTLAARNGSTNILSFLIRNGADVNAQDKNGFTTLMASIDRQKAKTVALLLS